MAPAQRSRRNPFARWLSRNTPNNASTHDTTTTRIPPPTQAAQLGRRIIDDDMPGASTQPRTTSIPVEGTPAATTAATIIERRTTAAGAPRAYSRTPSPNLPPPPRKGNERASDTSDEENQRLANAGLLPTPDTEFNTFGREGGGRAKPYPTALSRAASPPTAFPTGGGGLPSTLRHPSPGAVPRRSTSMQEARRLQRRQQRRASGTNSVTATADPTPFPSATVTRSNSPSDLSMSTTGPHGDGNAGIARAPSVPFTFGIARGRDTQDRLRGGSGRASSVDSGGMAASLSLAAATLPEAHHTLTESAAARLTDSPSSFLAPTVVTPPAAAVPVVSTMSSKSKTGRFNFNLAGFASGATASAGTSDGTSATEREVSGGATLARGSEDGIRATGVNRAPLASVPSFAFPDSDPPPHPDASASPRSASAAAIAAPSFTTTTTPTTAAGVDLEAGQGGGGLAPRPPSPTPSAASRGSRFREMLEDDPDRVTVVPSTPTDDEPRPLPSSEHRSFFERPSFFGSSERSSEGLKLMGKRGTRPVAGAGRVRSRVISVESGFEVNVTPPTPSVSTMGLGVTPAADEDGFRTDRPSSKKEGKRKASDPDGVDSEMVGKRVHTLSHKSTASSGGAPSAYRNSKRIRLSTPGDIEGHQHHRGTWPRSHGHSPVSHTSHGPSSQGHGPPRPSSRASTAHSARTGRSTIPVHAIVNPRPSSVTGSNRTFHMRDPYARHPPPVGWRPLNTKLDTPHLHPQQQPQPPQSPPQPSSKLAPTTTSSTSIRKAPWTAWAFYLGFVLFPLWWIAALSPVRAWPVREKPDWVGWLAARDERAWRRRCRWMSGVALVIYIPIIALAAVYGPKATVTESQ